MSKNILSPSNPRKTNEKAVAPTRTNMRLIRYGETVAEVKNDVNLTFTAIEPGAYRIECTIPYLGQERGWIYSNPIYLF